MVVWFKASDLAFSLLIVIHAMAVLLHPNAGGTWLSTVIFVVVHVSFALGGIWSSGVFTGYPSVRGGLWVSGLFLFLAIHMLAIIAISVSYQPPQAIVIVQILIVLAALSLLTASLFLRLRT